MKLLQITFILLLIFSCKKEVKRSKESIKTEVTQEVENIVDEKVTKEEVEIGSLDKIIKRKLGKTMAKGKYTVQDISLKKSSNDKSNYLLFSLVTKDETIKGINEITNKSITDLSMIKSSDLNIKFNFCIPKNCSDCNFEFKDDEFLKCACNSKESDAECNHSFLSFE